MMTVRQMIGWAMIAALGAATSAAAFEHARAGRLADRVARFEACEAAVAGKPKARPAAEVCSKAVASADADADRERACTAALTARPENSFAVRMVCASAVKTVVAQRDAATGERESARAELTTLRASQTAAIRRAQADATIQAERKIRAAQAVERAPRNAAGHVVCDAACLRQRTGGEARAH